MVEKIAKRTVGIGIISLIVLLAVTSSIATVYSEEEIEIKYDDGSAESVRYWLSEGLGGMFAVNFTPPYNPCLLTKARFYILGVGKYPVPIKVRVLDSSKHDMLSTLEVTATSNGWYTVDLAQYEITIEGNFYIGFGQTVTSKPALGFDENYPHGRSWFVYKDGDWVSSKVESIVSGLFGMGYPDGNFMIRAVVQPIDSDGDGLYDHEEKVLGTDPKKADTDNDGLNDKIEKDLGTNPLKADTDGDGLNDGDEVNKYKTDPLKVDTDGDGLLDAEEVMKYQTDPLKTDTDGDGLTDKDEILKGTNPLKADSDGDGLNDAEELSMKTDPLRVDTDGDGLTDSQEIKKGTDPLKVDTDGDFLNDSIDPMPTNVFVPDILGLAVIVAIVIVVFAFRRRKKAAPPLARVEAPPVPPVPTTKYCVHCGAQMPVESIYCGKCGQMQ